MKATFKGNISTHEGRNLPKGIIRANYKCQYENPYNAFLTISNSHDNSYIVQSNYYKSFTWHSAKQKIRLSNHSPIWISHLLKGTT